MDELTKLAIKARQDMYAMHTELSANSYKSINELLDYILK